MNDRERIMTLLSGGVPDRVPWFGDLTYWAAAMEQAGQVPLDWQTSDDYYAFHRQLGVGFYLQGYYGFRELPTQGVEISEERRGDVRTRVVETPVGVLREQWRFLSESAAWAPTERMIKSPQDLAPLRYWWHRRAFEPAPEEAARRRPLLDELGVVLCYLPRSPFMELTTELAGISHIVDLWLDAREEFEETLLVMGDTSDRAAEAALQAPADCLMIPENLSSEVVGRKFYERYVSPWEKPWVQHIREAGMVSFIHMDGTLRGLVGRVAETGFDVIEAVTPRPVGDLAMDEVRVVAGPHPILWGGIPGIYFTSLVSDAEFDRHVREMLGIMVTDRRMVLGVADQVPPDGLRSRMARVAELVERYGQHGVC